MDNAHATGDIPAYSRQSRESTTTDYTMNTFPTSFQNWMSDLEIFTSLMAAIIHDYDHTGTTNNFHINSGSSLAYLYNDRAVLENHHVSAFFR